MTSVVLSLLIVATSALGTHALSVEPKVLNIDYQIHSNNDLDELPQVLLKGARRFKFDPHYVPASAQCGDQKSCLLLNHDRPATEFESYNTSTELLNYLKSDDFATITNGERVTVALCFKSAPDKCQNTTAFNNWLRLVDDFYLQAHDAPRQIEFIVDGDAAPTQPCLVGRWSKWNSVWINSNSPSDAFYSNAEESDYYRFQVLNNPESQGNWSWMASAEVNYGKFSNGSYPYQLWEPDSQQDIRDYIGIYQSGAVHIPAGFHFAINVDIAMFRVYSARYGLASHPAHSMAMQAPAAVKALPGCETSLSISQPLVEDSSVAAVDTNPLLVRVLADYFVSVTARSGSVALSVVEANRVELTAATTDGAALSAADSAWLLADQGAVSLVSAVLLPGQDASAPVFLVANSAGHLLTVTAKVSAGQVTVTSTSQGSMTLDLLGATVHDVQALDASTCTSEGVSFCLQALASYGSSVLSLSTVSAFVMSDGTFNSLVDSTLSIPAPADATITSAKLARLDQDSAAQTLVFCAQDLTVFATEVGASSPVWSTVTVGKQLQLAVAGSGADQVLMLVTDYGYCYNSHGHNTRAYPTVCSSTPVPTETVLDYSLGLAHHWLDALRSDAYSLSRVSVKDAQKSFLAHSCSDKILHGSYDQGSRPAIALSFDSVPAFARNSTHSAEAEKMYFFLEAHEGVPTSTPSVVTNGVRSRGGGECGDPIHRDGVVLDAFAVDSWVRSLKRVYA